jgi:hypothetical protein
MKYITFLIHLLPMTCSSTEVQFPKIRTSQNLRAYKPLKAAIVTCS